MALSIADRGHMTQTGRIVLADRGSALFRNDDLKKAYLGR
jgi:ABC-type branched-subunit amino acid transport system ATPase component